jgi:pimeloyl-ACP methyl ester carboxylesterase
VLPVIFGLFAVVPLRAAVGAPPDGFEEVTLAADDGIALTAWYRPPSNGAAIVLIHGAGDSREAVRPYAAMLARHGYGVLALDLRGHGTSGGATNRFGWQDTRDVGAAIAFLETQSDVTAIGGLGISLGGEALLGAASMYPAVRAIAADGATQRSSAELFALESERPLHRSIVTQEMYAVVQLLTGEAPPEPPLLESMTAAESTRFLLIAGGSEAMEVAFNERFASAIGSRAELWVVEGAGHTEAFGRNSTEYEQRVVAFYDAALLE